MMQDSGPGGLDLKNPDLGFQLGFGPSLSFTLSFRHSLLVHHKKGAPGKLAAPASAPLTMTDVLRGNFSFGGSKYSLSYKRLCVSFCSLPTLGLLLRVLVES